MPPIDQKRKGRVVAGAVGILLSIGYTVQATQLPLGTRSEPGAAVFPLIVGVSFAIVSLLTILEAWRTEAVTGSIELPSGKDRRRPVLLLALFFSYAVALPFLGQLLASTLFVATLLRLLSDLSWPRIVLYTVAISSLTYWLFVMLLRVPMPGGFLGF